jgi:hypothetical protein
MSTKLDKLMNIKVLLIDYELGILNEESKKQAIEVKEWLKQYNYKSIDGVIKLVKAKPKTNSMVVENLYAKDKISINNISAKKTKYNDKKSYLKNTNEKITEFLNCCKFPLHLKKVKKFKTNFYCKIIVEKTKEIFNTKQKLSKADIKKRNKRITNLISYKVKKSKIVEKIKGGRINKTKIKVT